jgi:hypothetical protein
MVMAGWPVKNIQTIGYSSVGGLTLRNKMKRTLAIIFIFFCIAIVSPDAAAQCAVCTKTALQMGEKPAKGLNSAILYLMLMPFAIVGFIGVRWWRNQKHFEKNEQKQKDLS